MAAQGRDFVGQAGREAGKQAGKKFNVDLLAIGIALALAGLIRFNVIGHVGF